VSGTVFLHFDLMETNPPGNLTTVDSTWKVNLKIALYILGTLLLFFFAIQLMVGSLTRLGGDVAQAFVFATSNPFNGLLIGMLVTAMLQSSSTTTALVVAFVASRSIQVDSAIPIIMGANVGTTVTSAIVALGFISKKKEFKRAFAAGTYHHIFNILSVIVLFPLELHNNFLSGISQSIAVAFFSPVIGPDKSATKFSFGFDFLIQILLENLPAWVVAFIAVALLFTSILLFRRMVSNLLKARSPEAFSRFFFSGQLKSFGWGILTTAAIRSSTITTSVVVPIVAKKIATLKQAAPFIIGCNIGTTITAFIAVTWYANTRDAITIAVAHFLFNLVGAVLFFPIPILRKIPIKLAGALGRLSARYRMIAFAYLLSMFFVIPFLFIYVSKDKNPPENQRPRPVVETPQ
jgi:solute carrier family 34 (sodium-dependent phosphate cotransporter)